MTTTEEVEVPLEKSCRGAWLYWQPWEVSMMIMFTLNFYICQLDFYWSSCQLLFESITALDARLIGNSGCCAFNLHCLVWLWAPECTEYLLNRGVIISSSDFSIPFFCQVERLVSSLGHPALLKESYKIWPCLATSAYIYLAHDCVMYKQGVIRLMIILPPELIHDPMMVRMVYYVLCPLTLYFSQNLSR